MRTRIRVMVAEDHPVARVGITTIINLEPDMKVIAEAVNGKEAVELYRRHRPDIAILDIRMPIMSGIEAAVAIQAEFAGAPLVALSSYGGDEHIRKALGAGMRAYLTKDVLNDELLSAIRAVYAGRTYLPAEVAATLGSREPCPHLSAREVQALELIAQGLPNKEIAYSLRIGEETVRSYVKSILHKLGVRDRTQAATEAIQRGIIHF